jgi:two-component system cell cycle sensor histidine kinase/response regulator CckA
MAGGRGMSIPRIAMALVSWAVYGLAFIPIHRLLGPSVATLNILPVVATGLLLGMWAGLIASLTAFPVSLLLLLFSGEVSWTAMIHGGGLTGSILLVLIGTAVGLLHDKVEQVKKELAKRARAEEALRKSEATLQLQIERMPNGCIMWDLNFLVVSWNPAAARIFGFTEEEARGKHPYDLIVPKSAQLDTDRIWQRLLEGDISATSVNENITKDGRTITCDWTNTPLREDGNIVGVLSMVQDITERKLAEEQLRESEGRVRQMQKMEAIGQLAGGIAHDFNNILMVILGFSDLLLLKLASDDSLLEYARTIKTAALKASDLTNQLLAFSRKQMIQPRVVCLNELIRDGEKMLRRLIREDVELVLDMSPEAGQVKVDPGQVSQILMNLSANARDAMPQGGKLIIETRNVDFASRMATGHAEMRPGRYVMMAITDNGVGMDDAIKSHLFEPFFTTKELGKGTGLGLATVYGIVKQSKGFIYACSELGKGTTFKTYLPRIDTPRVADEGQSRESGESLRGTETILLVEDEVEVRNLVRIILQNSGYTVVEAENGKEAVRKCREMRASIHGMVTDVVMPQMGGKDAVRQIRQLCPNLVVLFMTGYTEDFVTLNEMLDEGMAILQKPLRAEDLLRQLRDSLDRMKGLWKHVT